MTEWNNRTFKGEARQKESGWGVERVREKALLIISIIERNNRTTKSLSVPKPTSLSARQSGLMWLKRVWLID